ncbi:MAG TPA: efflux RND transporter periplasmic adaptor subunit [Candidatus Acidoferrales bacterium]|nr:efflux RND transporter periplasmic adaptor subunit [Candidatus Acidoferrales bacterium]
MPRVDSRQSRVEGWKLTAAITGVVLALCGLPYALAQHVHEPAAAPAAAPTGERKILYWYDPMHPQYRSDKPGTAPDCGMDLVPKYADTDAATADVPADAVRISPLKQQLTGIRTAPVVRRTLIKDIRTVGIVQPDERRIRKIHAKFPGWVDKLFVGFTGQPVQAGDPTIAIYSPELVSTQTEYLLAWRGEQQLQGSPFPEAARNAQTLLDATRRRLLLWDITPQQIRQLEESGKPQTAVTLHSPASGYVTVKGVYQGLYVTPEMELYTVTDLSRVWVMIDVYEYEMPFVRAGTPVNLTLRSQPGQTMTGTVAYVDPYLDNQSRTNKVRVEVDNADLRLKPQMYASAEIHAVLDDRLAVPKDAVLDSGTKQVVFVAAGDGYFQPRDVRLGQRAEDYVEVLDGVKEGEQVVVAANFMVDSESQLKAALESIGHQH